MAKVERVNKELEPTLAKVAENLGKCKTKVNYHLLAKSVHNSEHGEIYKISEVSTDMYQSVKRSLYARGLEFKKDYDMAYRKIDGVGTIILTVIKTKD